MTRIFLLSLLLSFAPAAISAQWYIGDELYVPIRKGQSNKFAILHRGIPSGTKVTLIEREKEWSKITTSGGITGWVRNQFLQSEAPAKVKIIAANKQLATLSTTNSKLEEDKATLEQELNNIQNALTEALQQISTTEKAYDNLKSISTAAVKSHEKVKTLAEQIKLLETENDVLKSENESLRTNERTTFFLYGACAVLIGALLTIILPKLRSQKRNNGWLN